MSSLYRMVHAFIGLTEALGLMRDISRLPKPVHSIFASNPPLMLCVTFSILKISAYMCIIIRRIYHRDTTHIPNMYHTSMSKDISKPKYLLLKCC